MGQIVPPVRGVRLGWSNSAEFAPAGLKYGVKVTTVRGMWTRTSLVLVAVFLTLSFPLVALSAPTSRTASCAFLPDNSQLLPAIAGSSLGVPEAEFLSAVEELHTHYDDLFRAQGQSLQVQANWSDAEVNSFATRDEKNNPVVVAPGGIARHPLMTRDGFLLVLCHEVGHFLGGAPKAPRGDSGLLSWSSAEGEADYFAGAKCLKHVFNDEKKNQQIVQGLAPQLQQELQASCTSFQCMRIAAAAQSATAVFAAVTGSSSMPQVNAKDPTEIAQTTYLHPSPQCRLDTLISGARCPVSADTPFDEREPAIGACTPDHSPAGTSRPGCWYKP